MTDKLPSGEKFIQQWFENAFQNDELNNDILVIIESNMDDITLDEEGTLKELIERARTSCENDG